MNLFSNMSNKTKNNTSFYSKLLLIALSSATLSACSSTKNSVIYESGIAIHDPMEEANRKFMAFNMVVDNNVIHPLIRGYRTVTPKPARTGIRNLLRNLHSPLTIANQLLQGDISGARDALLRATINSTLGIGGIFDLAGYEGIEYEQEDFGQTLAVWGLDHGPYMVLPFIGPSSLRDYSGYLTDSFADPLRWYLFNTDEELLYTAKFGANYLDLRDSLMDTLTELEDSSIDYYAAVRSTYYQHRASLINDQQGAAQSSMLDIPDYDY